MAKTTPAFVDNYKRLNASQKEAVDAIEGPVMVVAGPGTGKTQILTLRIANILLKTDTPPDAVLALTFTEAGADAMKRRLVGLIGPTAYKVPIHTFHGFCNDVIRTHPERFPRIVSSVALTDIEAIVLIREAISTSEVDLLRPFGDPYHYVPAIKSAIGTLKREHKRPEDVLKHTTASIEALESAPDSFHEKGAHKGKMKAPVVKTLEKLRKEEELGRVFLWYEEALATRKKFDFEDMINEVVRALEEDEMFRLLIQEQYLYILADEHQDANGSQNRLLELLTSYDAAPNIFIVGDEKQAIFRFQGALLDSFERFRTTFPTARLIPLTESYRSGSAILNAAHALMRESIPPERHPILHSKVDTPEQAVLEVRTFSTEEYENSWITTSVADEIARGVSAGDIAIIVRTNADAVPIARALSQKGILHVLDSKSNIFNMHTIAQFVTYLRLVTHIGNDEHFAHVLHFPWVNIQSQDAYRIFLQAQKHRVSYIDVVSSDEMLHSARVADSSSIRAFSDTLLALTRSAQEESARDFFDSALHKSGFLTYVLTRPDAVPILNAVRGLVRELETLSSGTTLYTGLDFVNDLALYEEYGIEIEPDVQPKEREHAVHIVTAHRSKGLEYEHVYIAHARDGHWGNRTQRDKITLSTLGFAAGGDTEDERRLFYVALTRAKRFVSVSYGTTSHAGGRESGITQFMLEIQPELTVTCDTQSFEASIAPEDMFAREERIVQTMSDKDFLRDAFLEQGLSATALNNYLSCPWKYFYRNLVRVPEKPTPSSLYGNAMHNALRLFRDVAASTNEYPPLQTLLAYLEDSLGAQGFTPSAYEDAQKKGVRALTDWHTRHSEEFFPNALCEKKFEVYMTTPDEPERVLLRGMIDVIEYMENGAVRVIDYKTGKHKSRNELEGGTKNATGDYKRQLDFYCILLELAGMEQPKELVLEFVEPDEKGKTATHTFTYDERAVSELKGIIERVANEIYTLSFWDRRCDEPECEYCALHLAT